MKSVAFISTTFAAIIVLAATRPGVRAQWSDPAEVSHSWASTANLRAVADSKGNIHVVYDQYVCGGSSDQPIYDAVYQMLPAGGDYWTAPVVLTRLPGLPGGNLGQPTTPDIAVDHQGNVHIVYRHLEPGRQEESAIYHITGILARKLGHVQLDDGAERCADGTSPFWVGEQASWGNISGNAPHNLFPAIVANEYQLEGKQYSDIAVVWEAHGPTNHFNHDLHGNWAENDTWMNMEQVDGLWGFDSGAQLAVDGQGTIHLVYEHSIGAGPKSIYYKTKRLAESFLENPESAPYPRYEDWSAPELVAGTPPPTFTPTVGPGSPSPTPTPTPSRTPTPDPSWTPTPFTPAVSYRLPSLTIDNAGRPHVIFIQQLSSPAGTPPVRTLQHAVRRITPTPTPWSAPTPVDVTPVEGVRPDSVVDERGVFHTAYIRDGAPYYATLYLTPTPGASPVPQHSRVSPESGTNSVSLTLIESYDSALFYFYSSYLHSLGLFTSYTRRRL
jgi:hypothetical protein